MLVQILLIQGESISKKQNSYCFIYRLQKSVIFIGIWSERGKSQPRKVTCAYNANRIWIWWHRSTRKMCTVRLMILLNCLTVGVYFDYLLIDFTFVNLFREARSPWYEQFVSFHNILMYFLLTPLSAVIYDLLFLETILYIMLKMPQHF